MTRGVEHWTVYNTKQSDRTRPRELCTTAMALAGPGAGRVALDVGAGAGVETLALLDDGWRVHALDYDGTSLARLRRRIPADAVDRLTTTTVDLVAAPELPRADLVYSGYTLSWLPLSAFFPVWGRIIDSLTPGGLLAVNIFGDRDSWAGDPGTTCLSEQRVEELCTGLDVLHWAVEDADGQAFSGPKHWHVIDVVARRPHAALV